jgi:hypothetical protein
MKTRWLTLACALLLVSGAAGWRVSARAQTAGPQAQAPAPAPAATAEQSPAHVIDTYCVTCHNTKLKTAGLALDSLDLTRVGEHPDVWEKVATKLRTREMPPPGRPRPDAATYTAATAALEATLDQAASLHPNPGRVAVHRLNRAEYANAVRDLLSLDVDSRSLLSAEEENHEGFENVASVLSVSPALLENYLSAARTVSRLAIGDPTLPPVVKTFNVSKLLVQDDELSDDMPLGSQGGTVIHYQFPLDGEYTFKVLLRRQLYAYIIGMGEPHQLDIRVDGTLVKRFTVGGEAKGMTMPLTFAGNTQGDADFELYMHSADAHLEARLPVTAGPHDVSVSFVRRLWEPEGIVQTSPQTGFAKATNESYFGNPAVEFVVIGGPYGSPAPGDSPSRAKIFLCKPKDAAAEPACAQKILTTIAGRAFRRPVTDEDKSILMDLYRGGRADGSFDEGIRRGLEWLLATPSFLFRVEREPSNTVAGTAYRLTDLELASRLSFFLWSSIPDEELVNAALAGKLKDPAVLDRQVRRMLRDPRSKALVDNFASRWLEISKLSGVVLDTDLYREFDENLRDAMAQETKLFVADQIQNDHSVLDLMTADYTFLNERLAKHYGIPDIYGSNFRRVALGTRTRAGLLGQASILTVTSYPNRTSVVTRGKWVLANLLGAPPPPPPADVPALKDAGTEGQPRSLRDRMEVHRRNPACASCHRRMDPLGFSLENFDADGKWRATSDGVPIDASAELPDGTKFEGADGLRSLVSTHKEEFARTLASRLLAYATGRGVDYSDQPAIRKIARDAAANDYRWSAIIMGVIKSVPFTMSTASEGANRQSASATMP